MSDDIGDLRTDDRAADRRTRDRAADRGTSDRAGHERRRCRRFGWTSLFLWAATGVLLELGHALKLAAYLDDPTTRLLLTLAHAHGAALALVVLVFGASGAPLFEAPRGVGRLLRAAGALVPGGFAAGAIAHPESDPSLGILLVPIGALCLLVGLARTAVAAWRA